MLVVTAEEEAEECSGSAKTCGNLTISDPFWLVNKETGRSCGSPDFQLTCYNNTPFLRSTGSVGFTIINITYQEHSMRAIDQGKLELLHDSNSCYVSWNTSVKLGSSFRISPANQNLILYNCTVTAAAAARRDGALVETTIRCGNESGVFARVEEFYDGTTNNADYAVEGCEAIVVPAVGSSGEANASDYEQLITDGFLLTWDGHPPLPLARSKRTGRKVILIVISAAAALLFASFHVFMCWYGIGRGKDYGFSSAKGLAAALKGITMP